LEAAILSPGEGTGSIFLLENGHQNQDSSKPSQKAVKASQIVLIMIISELARVPRLFEILHLERPKSSF